MLSIRIGVGGMTSLDTPIISASIFEIQMASLWDLFTAIILSLWPGSASATANTSPWLIEDFTSFVNFERIEIGQPFKKLTNAIVEAEESTSS